MHRTLRQTALLVLIALTTPAALGLETLARRLLLPAEWEAIRRDLHPTVTPVAWVLLALTVASIPAGFATYRALARRFLARADALGGSAERRATARLEAMFVATSLPQIPAALATLTLTAGSDALPVVLAVALSAVAAAAIGLHDRAASPEDRAAP